MDGQIDKCNRAKNEGMQKEEEKLRVTREWRDEGNNNSNKKGGVTREGSK